MALRRRRDIWDVVIIGGGMAGLTAAWQASRRGLSVALLEAQPVCGGQIATVNEIDDYPSTTPVSGPEVAASLAARISTEGVSIIYESVSTIAKVQDLWSVKVEKDTLRARRIIAASGASLRVLGIPGEEKLRGMGVSQCAHCDGGFFRGQDVAVIGGGDAALQEAVVLANMCRSVYVVVRSPIKARRTLIDRAASKDNLRFIWNVNVEEILGDNGVTGLALVNTKDGTKSELPCSGVFPFVGVEPNAAYLPPAILRDRTGAVFVDSNFRTTEPTLYAIGALRAGFGGDIVSAIGEAALAAKLVAEETGINTEQ